MAGSYDTYSVTPRPAWRKYAARSNDVVPARHQAHNGISPYTPYGEILSGTVMMNAVGLNSGVRPLGLQTLEDAIVSGNAANVGDAACFYVTDRVDIVAGEDLYDGIGYVAGSSEEIIVTAKAPGDSRIRVQQVDPGGVSQPLVVTVDDDGTWVDVVVSLETDGGSAIVSTVAEVVAALNADPSFSLLFAELGTTGAETAIATSPQELDGGALAGEKLVDDRNVTDVDKTSDPNVITFDGAAVDVPAGAVIKLHALTSSLLITGILEDQIDTARRRAGETVARDARVTVAVAGTIRTSEVTGWDDALAPYLAGGEVSSGALGQGTALQIDGFVMTP